MFNKFTKSAGPEEIRGKGLSRGREFGGRVCCNPETKELTATDPDISKSGEDKDGWTLKNVDVWEGSSIDFGEIPKCPAGTNEVSRYHSHPAGKAVFSPGDRESSGSRFPFAVATPDDEETSIIEPIVGDHDAGYGMVPNIHYEWRGWGVNDDGTLVPKAVAPPISPKGGAPQEVVSKY